MTMADWNRSVLLFGDAINHSCATGFCADNRKAITSAYVLGGTSAMGGKVWDALLASTAM